MKLTDVQLGIAERTMSSNAFHHIVMHHAVTGKSLSVVRMGDGEVMLLDEAKKRDPADVIKLFEPEWNLRMGIEGLTYGELSGRLAGAAKNCTYFGPSTTGIVHEKYNVLRFFDHPRLVDNFFVNQWSTEQKKKLFDACHDIIVVHRSIALADEFQRLLTRFRVTYLPLSSWQQADDVIKQAVALPHRLVLFSAGPGAKYIGPQIAKAGKITIDVGNAMEQWLPR